MYRYTLPPQYQNAPSFGYGYSNYPTFSAPSPRDRYLAAIAEAKAAEAEYLAAEAARQEEQALRQRLAEIEYQRQLQEQERQRQLRASYAQRLSCPHSPAYFEAEVPHYGQPAQRHFSCQSHPHYVSQPTCASYCQPSQPRASLAPAQTRPELRNTSQPISLDELMSAFTQRAPNAPAPQPKQEVPQVKQANPNTITIEQLANLLSGRQAAPTPKPVPPKAPSPPPAPTTQPIQSLDQLFKLFLGGAAQTQTPSQPRPVSPAKLAPAAASSSKPIAAPVQEPKAAEKGLKEQLEARLNNEYASEVRDTIEALLASLSDHHAPSKSTPPAQPTFQLKPQSVASSASSTDKGKAKEVEQRSATVPFPSALNTISNIQTTFHNLESEFVFPAHLDFVAPSEEDLSTPTSPGGNYTSKLAFTSNNQPFRFYQQALGTLLSKLDAIESHGNEELRKHRKVVVTQVEKALEELENEVEARWKTWVGKQKKEKAQQPQEDAQSEVTVRPRRESKGHVDVEEVEDEAVKQEREKRRSFSGSELKSILAPIDPEEIVKEAPKSEIEEVKAAPVEASPTVEELPPVFISEPSSPVVVPSEISVEEVENAEQRVEDAEVVVEVGEVEENAEEVAVELEERPVDLAPSPSEGNAVSNEPPVDDIVVEDSASASYPPESSPASSEILPDASESTATIRPSSPAIATSNEDQSDSESEFELSETEGFLHPSDSETSEPKRPAYKDRSDDEWSEL